MEPWKDFEVLKRMYWEEGKSLNEIGEEFGVSGGAIRYWMEQHSLERRISNKEKLPSPRVNRSTGGMCWEVYNGEEYKCLYVHRLLAIAEFGFDAVCDKDVHHKNSIPWDNRPENIELKGKAEHAKFHDLERYGGSGWRDKDSLEEEYLEKEKTAREIAEDFGCTHTTILTWMDKFGIPRRDKAPEMRRKQGEG